MKSFQLLINIFRIDLRHSKRRIIRMKLRNLKYKLSSLSPLLFPLSRSSGSPHPFPFLSEFHLCRFLWWVISSQHFSCSNRGHNIFSVFYENNISKILSTQKNSSNYERLKMKLIRKKDALYDLNEFVLSVGNCCYLQSLNSHPNNTFIMMVYLKKFRLWKERY